MTFKNLMNNSTSHLMSMLCKSSTSKYMIIRREHEKYDKANYKK